MQEILGGLTPKVIKNFNKGASAHLSPLEITPVAVSFNGKEEGNGGWSLWDHVFQSKESPLFDIKKVFQNRAFSFAEEVEVHTPRIYLS